ncbi:hypothetical protein M0802_005193 [Mischocyttarus mexicanus]|nr:hypothetical protein M0802_005193 [Mischocyttarus mexicanus]
MDPSSFLSNEQYLEKDSQKRKYWKNKNSPSHTLFSSVGDGYVNGLSDFLRENSIYKERQTGSHLCCEGKWYR